MSEPSPAGVDESAASCGPLYSDENYCVGYCAPQTLDLFKLGLDMRHLSQLA